MLHLDRLHEMAYIISVLQEHVQPRAVHAHAEYIKVAPHTLAIVELAYESLHVTNWE